MKNTKKKRGRPPKNPLPEVAGLSAEGAVNLALDKNIKSELQNQLAGKSEDMLTNGEKSFLKSVNSSVIRKNPSTSVIVSGRGFHLKRNRRIFQKPTDKSKLSGTTSIR